MNITAIIFAAAVVGGTGLVVGLLLGIASEAFKVPVDEKEVAVRACLPGNNCGGCGFPGCAGFAEAIVEGKVPNLSACRPGKPDKNFNPIIKYMDEHPNADGTKVTLKI